MQIHRSEDSGEIFAGLLALENCFAPGLRLGRRTQRTQPGDDFDKDSLPGVRATLPVLANRVVFADDRAG